MNVAEELIKYAGEDLIVRYDFVKSNAFGKEETVISTQAMTFDGILYEDLSKPFHYSESLEQLGQTIRQGRQYADALKKQRGAEQAIAKLRESAKKAVTAVDNRR